MKAMYFEIAEVEQELRQLYIIEEDALFYDEDCPLSVLNRISELEQWLDRNDWRDSAHRHHH